MSSYTPNLDLLKKDPVSDLSQTFNVGTMMNDNWDKIDSFVALVAASIAPAYSASSAYAVGDWCTHGGKLWQCATAIGTGGEAWNASHWTAKSTADLIAAVKASIPSAYTSNPAMNGTASPGNSTTWARGNHVHPKDTSKADQSLLDTFVRPNLLDNWYFVGGGSQQGGGQFPINTNGQTSYSQTKTIDRWASSRQAPMTISSGYITISQDYYNQIIDRTLDVGTVCSISLLMNDGTLYTNSGALQDTQMNLAQDTAFGLIRIENRNTFSIVVATGNTASVVAAKWELGPTQTLAHQENGVWVLNEIPDYNEQMLRCNEGLGQFAQVEHGSYTGTGTYGSANANSLTFPFVPKFLLVKQEASSAYSIAAANGLTSVYSDYSTTYSNTMTWSDKTVTWYSTSAQRQLNTSDTVYHYVAVG